MSGYCESLITLNEKSGANTRFADYGNRTTYTEVITPASPRVI